MEHRFPLIPAADASGTVDAVGPGVTGYAVGDEVFGSVGKPLMGAGSLAELATMSTGTIARKPASVDHADAAAIPIAGVTALNMLDAIPLADGHVVVVIGATGGVGSYLVQIATTRGARVVAINSTANADYARSLGVADVIAYDEAEVVEAVRSRYPDGIDGVADLHRERDLVARLAESVARDDRAAAREEGDREPRSRRSPSNRATMRSRSSGAATSAARVLVIPGQ